MQQENRILPFGEWCERNGGLLSLLLQVSAGGPLPSGIRIVADPSRSALRLLAKVCSSGPEGVVATVVDWTGGFFLRASMHGGQEVSTAAIPSEAATEKALRAMAEEMSGQGLDAPIVEFMPGGSKYDASFHPLLQPGWAFPERLFREIGLAARLATQGGAVRVAPPSFIPDTVSGGMDVYDVRVGEKLLASCMRGTGEDPSSFEPMLLEQYDVLGGSFALLVDGRQDTKETFTWMTGAEGLPLHECWNTRRFSIVPAPEPVKAATSRRRIVN